MRDIIRDLVINGVEPNEIRAVLDKYEAEMAETAALAKEAEIEEARMVLMDALAKYYITAGILTEEEIKTVNWDYMIKGIVDMEQSLLKLKKTLADNHPSIKVKVSEAPGERRSLNFEEFLDEIENMFK